MLREKISCGNTCSECTIRIERPRRLTGSSAPKPSNWRCPPLTSRASCSNAECVWWDSDAEECWWAATHRNLICFDIELHCTYFLFFWLQVNHLSKRHPEMRIDDVPELTLPIIKPNRDYFCQYCDKVCFSPILSLIKTDRLLALMNPTNELFSVQVYKSASKRKAHILKNHPGAELPPSIRKLRPAAPGEPDPMLSTHTQLTGTIATAPVCCPHCAKQYSSKVSISFIIWKYSLEICVILCLG